MFLGFVIDTKINWKQTKQNIYFCDEVIKYKVQSIWKIASLLVGIVASFEPVPLGPLYLDRNTELCKIEALKAA